MIDLTLPETDEQSIETGEIEMPLRPIDENFTTELMGTGAALVVMQHQLEDIVARWTLNGIFDSLGSFEPEFIAKFPHLTQSKMSNAINALIAVRDALGEQDDDQSKIAALLQLKG